MLCALVVSCHMRRGTRDVSVNYLRVFVVSCHMGTESTIF